MTGAGPHWGRRQEPSPAGREPYGLGEPTPGGPSPLPGANGPAATRPPAPAPRVKRRLTVDGPAAGRQLAQAVGSPRPLAARQPRSSGTPNPGAAPECWRGPWRVLPGRYRCTG